MSSSMCQVSAMFDASTLTVIVLKIVLSVWKPLKGPVQDWPLAMCDPRSIKPETDLEPCDLVYPGSLPYKHNTKPGYTKKFSDYVVENRQLYHSPRHEWMYLADQQPSEAWVFLQSDTTADVKSGLLPSPFKPRYISGFTKCHGF